MNWDRAGSAQSCSGSRTGKAQCRSDLGLCLPLPRRDISLDELPELLVDQAPERVAAQAGEESPW